MPDRFKIHEESNADGVFGAAATTILLKSFRRTYKSVTFRLVSGVNNQTAVNVVQTAHAVWDMCRAYGALCAVISELPDDDADKAAFFKSVRSDFKYVVDQLEGDISHAFTYVDAMKNAKLPPDVPADNDASSDNGECDHE